MDSLAIFLRPRVPSRKWIRWIQYATHRNKFTSSPKSAMSTAMQNFAQTPSSYFTSGKHFLETRTLLPKTTRTTKSRWLQRLFPQTANTIFATLMTNISLSHVPQHALLSQLYYNFKSFTYFFLSYETCSINVNSLFHAAIKNLHVKANDIFVFLLLYPPLSTTNSEGITHTRKNIYLCPKTNTNIPSRYKGKGRIHSGNDYFKAKDLVSIPHRENFKELQTITSFAFFQTFLWKG